MKTILDKRNKRAEHYSYKLMDNSYGLDIALPDRMDIDEKRMSAWIPFADGKRRDGVGDLLEVGGIRTDRHRSNPIVLFDHGKHVTLPIGLAEDPDTGIYTVELDPANQAGKCNAFFYQGKKGAGRLAGDIGNLPNDYEHSIFCEQIFDLLCKKYIRAGSIGYQVIHAKELQPNYEYGTPKGLHLLSVLMLEASIVVMPANQDTVRKVLSLPKVCDKALSPILVKSLSPYLPQDRTVVVPVPRNVQQHTDVPPAKWKPGLGAMKGKGIRMKEDLSEVRVKYKKVKNLRRRLRKSTTGSSLIYIQQKDLIDIQKDSQDKNVKCELRGKASNGFEKIKLSGSDADIDFIANKYGRSIKSNRMQHNKKSLKSEDAMADKEDFDLDKYDLDKKDKGTPGMEESADEPYGASVLRRIHEDHRILMNDYDELLGPLENDQVHEHLRSILEHIEETLSLTEDLFEKIDKYKGLPKLEGSMGKKTVEDDSSEVESPEEPVEEPAEESAEEPVGDEEVQESLPADSSPKEGKKPTEKESEKGMKSLRGKYSKKSMCQKCKCSECKCGKTGTKAAKPGDEENQDKPGEQTDATPEATPGHEENQDKPGEQTDATPEATPGNEEQGRFSKALEEYENNFVKGAADYLGELTNSNDYADEHRMKSYHFHKVLGDIGGIEDAEALKCYKSIPGDQQWMQEESEEADHKKLHPHRRSCGEASAYFKAISTEKAFGDNHRMEASYHHDNLKSIFGNEENKSEENLSNEVDGNSENEVENNIGEMDTKGLFSLVEKQCKEIEELTSKLQSFGF